MKVLEVLDSFYPNVDGPISVMVSLAKKFNESGLGEVELLVPSYPDEIEIDGVKIHRCNSVKSNEEYRAALPMFDAEIKKIVKEGNFDIIHTHSPFTLGHFALNQGKKLGIPVVFTFHTKFRDELTNRLKSAPLVNFVMDYIMRCIDGCDAVTSVSHGAVETLAEYGYREPSAVKVIYNATNMELGGADGQRVAQIRKQYGLEGCFTFIFVGRLAEVKNVQFSLETLAEVKKRGYGNFKFMIVGDGAYGKVLKKQAEQLGIEENVLFTGKIKDKEDLASYYAASDLMLFPSTFDTAGVVIFEAAANGVPSVTLKGSCASERIADGESGFIWDNDKKAWTENIIKLLNDPSAVKRAGAGAEKSVYVGWDKIAEEYLQFYNEILNRKIYVNTPKNGNFW